MCNVFALFVSSGDETEKVNLGSLYVKHDERGLISDIEVEPYDTEDFQDYEPHFDEFDQEFPEVPLRIHLGQKEASIDGFFLSGGNEVDLDAFAERQDRAFLDEAYQQYETILKSAYRLYERAQRGEPVFVGYVDIESHRQLEIDEILDINIPLHHLPMKQRRALVRTRRLQEAAEARRTLLRVTLESQSENSNEFPGALVLHVSPQLNQFPHRLYRVSGLADAQRPVVIMENGDLRLGNAEVLYTNFMSVKMAKGESVILWRDRCRSSQPFSIVQIESFIWSETNGS